MTVWVDGDSCHRQALEIILGLCRSGRARVCVAADRVIPGVADAGGESLPVDHGSGGVDDLMAESVQAGDIAVTRDLELASRLMEAGAVVINDRGRRWDDSSLARRRRDADLMQAMKAGGITGGSGRRTMASYGEENKAAFRKCLEKALSGA